MNKANSKELAKALIWLDLNDATATDVACRTLASLQRCGTVADQKMILSIIKERKLSHKFYTENHCLIAY